MEQKAGRIHVAGMVKDVSFEPTDDSGINQQIDEAYQKKYSKSPYRAHMLGSRAKSATVKIVPK
jgi:hypothetical protein